MKFSGIVVHGKKEASTQYNMPTANIRVPEYAEEGVFVGNTTVNQVSYPSLLCIRATPEGKILESHLINQALDVYGQEIEVEVQQKIRDLISYTDHESMHLAMRNDLAEAKKLLLLG